MLDPSFSRATQQLIQRSTPHASIYFEQSLCARQILYIIHRKRCTTRRPNFSLPSTSYSLSHQRHNSPSYRSHFFPTRKMADQSESPRFQVLFESALEAYQSKTGVTLAQHPLAVQLQSCHSVEDITVILQGRAQAFSGCRTSDKIMKSVKATVSILTPLSDAATLADAVGPVRHNVLMPCFTYLIAVFSDIIPTCKSNTS